MRRESLAGGHAAANSRSHRIFGTNLLDGTSHRFRLGLRRNDENAFAISEHQDPRIDADSPDFDRTSVVDHLAPRSLILRVEAPTEACEALSLDAARVANVAVENGARRAEDLCPGRHEFAPKGVAGLAPVAT